MPTGTLGQIGAFGEVWFFGGWVQVFPHPVTALAFPVPLSLVGDPPPLVLCLLTGSGVDTWSPSPPHPAPSHQ